MTRVERIREMELVKFEENPLKDKNVMNLIMFNLSNTLWNFFDISFKQLFIRIVRAIQEFPSFASK